MSISIWKRYHWNDVLKKSGLMFLVYEEYKDLIIELQRLKKIYTVQKLLMNIARRCVRNLTKVSQQIHEDSAPIVYEITNTLAGAW